MTAGEASLCSLGTRVSRGSFHAYRMLARRRFAGSTRGAPGEHMGFATA